MVIRAARSGLEIRELPIALHPREGQSKLSPFRDGWRSLRLMLVYKPNFLFLVPGLAFAALGTVLMGLAFVARRILRASVLRPLDRRLAARRGRGAAGRLRPLRPRLCRLPARRPRSAVGVDGPARAHGARAPARHRPDRDRSRPRRPGCRPPARRRCRHRGRTTPLSILAVTLIIVGMQVFFTSFLLSLVGLRRGGRAAAAELQPAQPRSERRSGGSHRVSPIRREEHQVARRIACRAPGRVRGTRRARPHSAYGSGRTVGEGPRSGRA